MSTVVGMQPLLSLLQNDDMNNYYQKQLEEGAQKCLAVISKYKRKQRTSYDELQVFDPGEHHSMPNDIENYPNLFAADEMEVLCASSEWKLYCKQRAVDDPDFDVSQWWERACNHMDLANLGRVALNALTVPVITTVAEGSFRIMKGPLSPDRRFRSLDSQSGYLLAMINGDVNKRLHAHSWRHTAIG